MSEIREKYIDLLKEIGLFCIILAHVNPPRIIFNMRNFDVILMIIISAHLSLKSQRIKNWKSYIISRFKRLVVPTWIFLTFFLFFLSLQVIQK